MTKRAFDKIAAGLNEAIDIAKGDADPSTYRAHVPDEVDVAAIRKALHMTQPAFAAKFGFPVSTVRAWEQKQRKPEPSARVLLRIIERRPEAVLEALAG